MPYPATLGETEIVAMDPAQEQQVKKIIEEGVKNSLYIHFKMLHSVAKQLEDPALKIPAKEVNEIKLGAQAEVTAQLYLWTYLNLCIENGDLNTLSKAWGNVQFRSNALISAIQLIHVKCQELINQYPIQIPQEQSLNTPFIEH